MEDFNFGGDDAAGTGGEFDFGDLGTYTGVQGPSDQDPELVTITLASYLSQQHHTQLLQDTVTASQHELLRQRDAIAELVQFNSDMYSKLHKLDTRVAQLEGEVVHSQGSAATTIGPGTHLAPLSNGYAVLGADARRSPVQNASKVLVKASAKRSVADAFTGEGVTMPGRTKYRKKLEVKIPSKANGLAPNVGLPTPQTSALQTAPSPALGSSFPTTPRTPYTPGRIGPPDSYKKTTTSMNKRDIHNLNKSIPPVSVALPMVPLTDTEVIVYFFNSLSRPAVSLRLYARGWGPATIVQSLNEHRVVEPPYLRNTCSVKCTTAIKNGRKLYGENWEAEHRAVFLDAEDSRATDLIRADENDTVEYYVRALGVNLKQHPSGADAGIFTACVKYCIENQAPFTMSNVHQLALALQDGSVVEHPASPAPANVFPPPHLRSIKEEDDMDEETSDDGNAGTPSPLAERRPQVQTREAASFTAVSGSHEHKEGGSV